MNSSCCNLYASAESSDWADPPVASSCDAWTKLLLLPLLLVLLLSCVSKLPVLVFMLPGPCMLLLLPGVTKLLFVLALSCTTELVLVFLVLMPPCVKLLLLGTLCFTSSSILAEHDAIEVLLASTSVGNRS
jgi:hypothetical protein